ncbi:hypothetical protein P3342_009279 [Pyrenophora teres f. teres]|nr:hypothetical protein P3342_009279 [Pyrenophora teres f. teres]
MNHEALGSSRSRDVTTHNGDHGLTINGDDESVSSLLRLPAELRVMIYEYTFANEIVHVQPKSTDPIADLYTPRIPGAQRYQSVISLLMTCRLIRKEASSIFNGLVTFDLTHYYNCMAAAYELGPDMCQTITSIKVEPRLAKRLAVGIQSGASPNTNYQHLLPSLHRVYIQDSPIFGFFLVSHDLAIRALRLYFGHDRLEVQFTK